MRRHLHAACLLPSPLLALTGEDDPNEAHGRHSARGLPITPRRAQNGPGSLSDTRYRDDAGFFARGSANPLVTELYEMWSARADDGSTSMSVSPPARTGNPSARPLAFQDHFLQMRLARLDARGS